MCVRAACPSGAGKERKGKESKEQKRPEEGATASELPGNNNAYARSRGCISIHLARASGLACVHMWLILTPTSEPCWRYESSSVVCFALFVPRLRATRPVLFLYLFVSSLSLSRALSSSPRVEET